MAVYLMYNHHVENRKEMVQLREEMFEWHHKETGEKMDVAYINVLKALMSLKEFEAEFCLEIDEGKKVFCYSHRSWAWILLKGKIVASYSHSEKDRHPFYSLYEWLEDEVVDEDIKKITVAEWRNLFLQKIKKQAEEKIEVVSKKKQEIEDELSKIQSENIAIKLALSSNDF